MLGDEQVAPAPRRRRELGGRELHDDVPRPRRRRRSAPRTWAASRPASRRASAPSIACSANAGVGARALTRARRSRATRSTARRAAAPTRRRATRSPMPSSPALASATRQSSSLHWRGSSGSASVGWRRVNDAPMNPAGRWSSRKAGSAPKLPSPAGPRIQRGSGASDSTQCPRGAHARIAGEAHQVAAGRDPVERDRWRQAADVAGGGVAASPRLADRHDALAGARDEPRQASAASRVPSASISADAPASGERSQLLDQRGDVRRHGGTLRGPSGNE